ncbi:MAG TPA: histidine kinase [Flavisolibacter sp.]|jgi:sensor histidine kinase YesM|nr:histidine kinase [Flavisolibacter sp.]
MASPFQLTSSPLKENIFFLTIGTFTGSIGILLFDDRLYTSSDVFLLFVVVFIAFIVQAFTGSIKSLLTKEGFLLLYLQSFFINFFFLGLLYFVLLPFSFDVLQTARFCLLITFIETSLGFFGRYKKQYQLNLEKEKLIGQSIKQQQVKELEVLKQQIDPHFIFNSFNTLAFLIDENSEKAKQFSNKLANVHRYIIFNSNKNLVSVADEASFAQDYAYLQEIRYSNEVQINFSGFADVDNVFILPVSIQILIENAIKHNGFTVEKPLLIEVSYEQTRISVENNLNPKNYDAPSSKIGLSNLRDRCRLILGKDLQIVKKQDHFKVLIPVLNK